MKQTKRRKPVTHKKLAIANAIAFLFVIVMNVLAVQLPLNNKTTGELSDRYPNMFTPAGITFSIWSVIYVFLAGFVIYQVYVLFNGKRGTRRIVSISFYFIINCIANGAWLLVWHYQNVPLSVLIMLVMLGTLIAIHSKLHIGLPWKPLKHKLWLDIPFSLYLGWISIATIANITTLFVEIEVSPFNLPASIWTMILIGVATLLTSFMVLRKRNIFFGLVVCWAFIGIILKRRQEATLGSAEIILTCQLCIALIVIFILIYLFRRRNTIQVAVE